MKPIVFPKEVRRGVPFLTIKLNAHEVPYDEFENTEMAHQYIQKLRRVYRTIYCAGINANIKTEV